MSEGNDDLSSSVQEEKLLSRVAWYYYHDGLTQNEIGDRLNLSRIKVSRLLEKGRRLGMIHVQVNSAYGACFELEERLRKVYGLEDAHVIPAYEGSSVTERLAEAASQYFMDHLKNGEMLAVGWGATVMGMLQRLAQTLSHRNISLVSLTGGVSAYIEGVASGRTSHNIHLIPAPLLVSSEIAAEAIREERHVVDIMTMAQTANYALIGIGAVSEEATLIATGYATRSQFETYRRQGAVGDIIGLFYDQNGQVLDLPVHQTLVGLNLDALRGIPQVVAAAGGAGKVDAIRAAAKGKLFKVLITDETTAQAMIERETS